MRSRSLIRTSVPALTALGLGLLVGCNGASDLASEAAAPRSDANYSRRAPTAMSLDSGLVTAAPAEAAPDGAVVEELRRVTSKRETTLEAARSADPSARPTAATASPAPGGDTRALFEGAEGPRDAASNSVTDAIDPGAPLRTEGLARDDDLSVEEAEIDVKARIDEILSRLDRRPGETPDAMFFRYWGDNPFVETASDPLSTFAVDVDSASYSLLRGYLFERGVLPPVEAIRTEELVNYFKGELTPPTEGEGAFAIHTELAPTPFAHEPEFRLLRIGVKAREVSREKRESASLVFVIDTSGSMRQGGRLELVKEALQLLVDELDEGDSIGIVAFDRESRIILEPTAASEKERITSAIASLHPRSNTNVEAGLRDGYALASKAFIADGSNRVMLLSDGVANAGVTNVEGLLASIETERRRGIYLTTVGVGMSNHNDYLLEQLADKGDGRCVYVDRLKEARRAFVENLTGTLQTVARDVKIQVELDPTKVLRYRQLGYENRAVADADFRNDRVDAGEVGAGHEVTALYELKLAPGASGDFATVRVRYLEPEPRPVDGGGEAVELERKASVDRSPARFEDASPRFQLAACVAEFAEVLRDSYWARGGDLAKVADRVETLLRTDRLQGEDETELVAILRRADALVRARAAEEDEVVRVVDLIRENEYDRARAETTARESAERERTLTALTEQNARLRRQLEDLLTSR